MKARSVFSGFVIFPLACAIVFPVQAQTSKHSAAQRPPAADSASRTQLAAELAEFQSDPQDAALRSRIIELAKSLTPAPAISQLAQTDFAKAGARMAAASSADDFETVAQLFEQIAVQAPWYADAYLNAATAYSKANEFDAAQRNLTLYQEAVRPGADTQNAELLRRSLERKQATLFQQTLQQFTANPTDAARIHVIQLATAMGAEPEIPEEARGHYVMATVFMNSAEDSADYDHAIAEYKAALLSAPWWGDAYKKLASAQTLAGKYDDAVTNMIFYQAAHPADTRATQDEIYRLKALAKSAADEQAKKQSEEQKRRTQEEQRKKELAVSEATSFTIEGRWYQDAAPSGYFVGGASNPQCDYFVRQFGGHWDIKDSCAPSKRTITDVEVQSRQISFKLMGRDADFPFSEVIVTFSLSNDGQTLEGRAVPYDKKFFIEGDHPVRWIRRK